VTVLKEPLARTANRSDGVRGAFFESRFKIIAIRDDELTLNDRRSVKLDEKSSSFWNGGAHRWRP